MMCALSIFELCPYSHNYSNTGWAKTDIFLVFKFFCSMNAIAISVYLRNIFTK